jgi:hypothetical protein
VYESGAANARPGMLRFGGVELAKGELPCLKRVSRFVDPDALPLLLPAILPAGWQALPLHQSLRRWEGDPTLDAAAPRSYWAPAALKYEAKPPLSPRSGNRIGIAAAVEYRAGIARVGRDGDAVVVDGLADASGSYLVAWRPMRLPASSILVAEGRLQRGGVTLGLAGTSGWASSVNIDTPGPFRAVIQAPGAGEYQFIVANHLRTGSLRNRFTISRIFFVDSGA